MTAAKRTQPLVPLVKLRTILKPVVEPVIERLERTETLLLEMRAGLDVQFKRTAEIQAQLDIFMARFEKITETARTAPTHKARSSR